ncbi:MAG TPA: pyridine nucleotide transhydrogenase [Burkholderiaceae bacterium]
MPDALIGATGFVGTTLLKSAAFDARYRSTDIGEIEGRRFGTVVCAGAPAQKWIANREPEADRAGIDKLIGHLDRVECDTFVLVSTVDVFGSPVAVDEDSAVVTDGLHAYGRHRFLLEEFVRRRFARHLVARLPGLVGPGLRKNAIHDLHHGHEVAKIDSRGVFQFYPMVNLWYDLQAALAAGLSLVHLTAEPVSVADVARLGFGRPFDNPVAPAPARYDMRSRHAAVFGGRDGYQYSARETIQAVRHYAQSEPARAKG